MARNRTREMLEKGKAAWMVFLPLDLIDEMKNRCVIHKVNMTELTEEIFKEYLGRHVRKVYTNESAVDEAINDLRDRVRALEEKAGACGE